ncbi:Adaptive-response sensory-kinase SasA [Afipia felis]
MTTKSLRRNLFLGIVTAVAITSGIAGYYVYHWAYDEAIEMQDSILMHISSIVKTQPRDSAVVTHLRGVDNDNHAILVRQGQDDSETAFRALWSLPPGLQDTTVDGVVYRAFLSEMTPGQRFAVLQHISVRDEIGTGMAIRTIAPILALIPLIVIITAYLVSYSFKNLVQLGRELDNRSADNLDALPLASAPSELQPFLTSLNRMFERTRTLMDRQQKLIGDAAHELRTPITALSIQAENLDDIDLPSDTRQRIGAVKAGAQRTRHLLEQLLAMARQEHAIAVAREIELGEATRKTVANLIAFANRKHIDLGLEQAEPLVVVAEAISIDILLRNVIDNAINYTPEGGRVDIELSRTEEWAAISISDTGPGIPEDELDAVFSPFVRGQRNNADGAGLGLSIVRRITDQLNGRIRLQNRASRPGLVVRILLPAQARSTAL